jgi:hypothetical protein
MKHLIKHAHLSTRYDKSVDALRRVVRGFTEYADIITLTEVDSEKREKALKFDGFGVITGDKTGRDDCGILWDVSVWQLIHKETFNVSPYMAGNIGAAVVILEHRKTGKAVLFSVIHTPSSVEGNGRVEGGRRDEWYAAVRNWRNKCKKLAKQYGAPRMVLVADWNINLKARWVRAVVSSLFPRWKYVWDLRKLPVGGTHGPRLIDFTIYKGKLKVAVRPKIHRSTAASDHKGYDEVLEIV